MYVSTNTFRDSYICMHTYIYTYIHKLMVLKTEKPSYIHTLLNNNSQCLQYVPAIQRERSTAQHRPHKRGSCPQSWPTPAMRCVGRGFRLQKSTEQVAIVVKAGPLSYKVVTVCNNAQYNSVVVSVNEWNTIYYATCTVCMYVVVPLKYKPELQLQAPPYTNPYKTYWTAHWHLQMIQTMNIIHTIYMQISVKT